METILKASAGSDHAEADPYLARAQGLEYLDRGAIPFGNLSKEVEERLDILVRIAEILGLDDLHFSSYSSALAHLTNENLQTKLSLVKLEHSERELRIHLESMRHEERLANKWAERFESDFSPENAASIGRKKDALVKKALEYRKELDELMVNMVEPTVTIIELTAQRERVRKREADIKTKRAKIKAFQGLPPNLEMARMELKRAQDEQTDLIKLRERILGRMAEGVS